MKKSAVTLTICLIVINLFAQTPFQIAFTYDEAGNRETREVILLKSTEEITPADTMENRGLWQDENAGPAFAKQAGEHTITVFPNPTKGQLEVVVSGAEPGPAWSAEVYDLGGNLLLKKEALSGTTLIDLSGRQKGMYILKILLPGHECVWKVVKE
ncbi:MAG: T9SS type A sorting domain-containing protein [Bacteroidales bacterium]|nr:T9SS type A sorting domain-containing protein [Bacteroidales bacterium]